MDTVFRAAAIYFFLLLIFNVAGKRSVAETNTFDFVVLLIISEATQQAMLGNDPSVTNSLSVIMTLIGISIIMSVWKYRSSKLESVLTGGPIILVQDGELLRDRMKMSRVDEADILQAARETQALERMEQIKYAIMEHSGEISIIPKEGEGG
jgi:uncharacterized membrane protein YcaP (DUF421 family)